MRPDPVFRRQVVYEIEVASAIRIGFALSLAVFVADTAIGPVTVTAPASTWSSASPTPVMVMPAGSVTDTEAPLPARRRR